MKKKTTRQESIKEKAVRQECISYFLLPEERSVRDLLSLLPKYEKTAEIWTELNVAELKLLNSTMFWEEASEDFSAERDLDFIRIHGIRQIYAATYDMQDQEEACKILDVVSTRLGGRVCGEEEAL